MKRGLHQQKDIHSRNKPAPCLLVEIWQKKGIYPLPYGSPCLGYELSRNLIALHKFHISMPGRRLAQLAYFAHNPIAFGQRLLNCPAHKAVKGKEGQWFTIIHRYLSTG